MDTFIKIDSKTIAVTKTTAQEIIKGEIKVVQYDLNFLIEQKKAVEQDLANVISRHAQELAMAQANVTEVNGLLEQANKLLVVQTVIKGVV